MYARVQVERLVECVRDSSRFLPDALATDTSWRGLYHGGLENRLRGKRVLELGAGDGLNAMMMAALGADVVANDISEETPKIIERANQMLSLPGRVTGIEGDFLLNEDFKPGSFDLIVGKAFLHHLDHPTEARFMKKVAHLLNPKGEARFFEPALNSKTLDAIRWMIPVTGRPSSFYKRAFAEWKAKDPHPDRDNSSSHYAEAALAEFHDVQIVCIGTLERLHRLLPEGPFNRKFRRGAYRAEEALPRWLQNRLARSQTIICSNPRSSGA